MKTIIAVLIILSFVVFAPLLVLSSLDTLFHLGVEPSFKSWLAVVVLFVTIACACSPTVTIKNTTTRRPF